jgi:NADH-quinone oxidoreductase subunit H
MLELSDRIIEYFGLSHQYSLIVIVVLFFVYGLFALTFGSLFAGITSWYERRIAGRMQSRIGPNRVGYQGFWQWLADGLKCWFKEDIIPRDTDSLLFRIAPYLVFTGVLCTFVVIPFSPSVVGSDMNVGIVYIIAITALVVAGILMAGWSSNSKWTLLGGIRSTAQMISYEIPVALSLIVVIIPAGTLSLQKIIISQGGAPYNWYIFHNPAAFVAFFVYFIAALAEGNRTPFDLPEAESELVAGYNTEYSGMRFLFFLFAEWMNLYVIGGIATALFLGGWRIPGVSYEVQSASIWLEFLGFIIYLIKALILVNVIIWLRWTLPRLRIDQLMIMCYKYLLPISILLIVISIIFTILYELFPLLGVVVRVLLFLMSLLILGYFSYRVYYNIKNFPDKVYLKWMI